MDYEALGVIFVVIPFDSSGNLELSRMSISKEGSDELNIASCPSMTIYINPGSTTSFPPPTLSKSWGPWKFTVSIENAANTGQPIHIRGNLTYRGPTNTTITVSKMLLRLHVYDSSGRKIWGGDPVYDAAYSNVTVIKGETFAQDLCIATASSTQDAKCYGPISLGQVALPAGTYSLQVAPLFLSYPAEQILSNNFTITVYFTVR